MQVWFLGGEDTLEKGMLTHSSILAYKIQWEKEPGGLQSMGLKESDMTGARVFESSQVYWVEHLTHYALLWESYGL